MKLLIIPSAFVTKDQMKGFIEERYGIFRFVASIEKRDLLTY